MLVRLPRTPYLIQISDFGYYAFRLSDSEVFLFSCRDASYSCSIRHPTVRNVDVKDPESLGLLTHFSFSSKVDYFASDTYPTLLRVH